MTSEKRKSRIEVAFDMISDEKVDNQSHSKPDNLLDFTYTFFIFHQIYLKKN